MARLIPSDKVVGYACDAAEHCLGCAAGAGMDLHGAVGREANEAAAILSGEVVAIACEDCLRPFCGFCGALIEEGACTNRGLVPVGERS